MLANKVVTTKVQCYSVIHRLTNFILVDTPGFDDSSGLDDNVVEEILSWLKASMGEGLLLNGLVYLHRINDPRISGTARSNMRLFRKLCGDENLAKVVLGTSFWTNVDNTTGQKREKQLLADPALWKPLVEKGSRAFRVKETSSDCFQILTYIAQKNDKFLIQAQEEMSLGQKTHETSAGRAMNLSLGYVQRGYDAELCAERRRRQDQSDDIDRKRREQHQKEQERIERQYQADLQMLERKMVKKVKEWESEARQALQEKIQRNAAEKQMQQKLDVAAQALRQRQISTYLCRNFDTKRVCCNGCYRRLDLVRNGKWCYRTPI
ncbi:MAG: hypothetical protein Q9227_000537 [Pyrenula ochraceoflavens]